MSDPKKARVKSPSKNCKQDVSKIEGEQNPKNVRNCAYVREYIEG